jgi:DeoR/GlpR family transcriptional regulator of sugar metabolism
LTQEERLKNIVHYLKENRKIRLEQICEKFDISRDSARRDLVRLEQSGTIVRTHGGAVLAASSLSTQRYEERLETMDAKRSIGRAAAHRITDGESVLMNASTTVQAAAEALTAKHLTVITNSLDITNILGMKEEIRIHLLGGEFNPWNRNVTGAQTLEMLSTFSVQTLLLGACSVNEQGISSPLVDEAYMKREMIRRADRVIVLADHQKFNKSFIHHVSGLQDIDMLITDIEPPPALKEACALHNIELIIAQGGINDDY